MIGLWNFGSQNSDLVMASHLAEFGPTNPGTSYIKIREALFGFKVLTLKVKWEMKSSGGSPVYARVYVDDVAVGSEQSTSSTSYVAKESNNIGPTSYGTKVQLYVKTSSGESISVKNFELCWNLTYFDPLYNP